MVATMKTFLKILLGIVIVGALAFGAVMVLTSGERDIARQFVFDLTGGAPDAARAVMHDDLRAQFPDATLNEVLAGVRPYTEVSFGSVEASGGVTTLEGSASTADGCSSKVNFEILDSKIIAFSIEPLCRN